MRLKSIKIFGFKSFPEKIEIHFDGSLIGLVGPNGCGKSNVIDAIRFAMGEGSPRALRAERMSDLVFGGNAKRKALSVAEVTLTFEGVDREGLPDELAVTRRLYRDGGSEYLVNGREVRLKDVEKIFLGTGVGKQAFYLFEQGKLDEIIRFHPKDRRAIFDETAGISLFLEQKKESMSRLAELLFDYNKIANDYESGAKSLELLKQQADSALAFLEKRERLETLKRGLALHGYLEEKKKGAALLESERLLEGQIREQTEKRSHLAQEQQTRQEEQERQALSLLAVEKRAISSEGGLKVCAVELKQLREKKERVRASAEEIASEIERIESASVGGSSFEEELKEKIAALEKSVKCKSSESKKSEAGQEMEHFEKEVLSVKQALFEKIRILDSERFRMQEQEKLLALAQGRMREIENRGKQAQKALDKEQGEWSARKREKEEIEKSIATLALEQDRLQLALAEVKERSSSNAEEINGLLVQIQAQERREMEEKGAIEELLGESKNAKSALYGKLKRLKAHGHPHYQRTLSVKSREDLKEIFQYAFKKDLRGFSLVLEEYLESIYSSTSEKRHFKNVSALIDSFQKGSPASSEEGLFVDAEGVFFYHSLVVDFQGGDLDLKERLKGAKEEKSRLEKEQVLKEKEKRALEERVRSLEMKHLECNFKQQEAISSLNRLKESLEKLSEERSRATVETSALEEKLASAKKLFREASEEEKAMQGRMLESERKYLHAKKERLDESRKIEERDRLELIELARLKERYRAHKESRAASEQKRIRLEQQLAKLKQEEEKLLEDSEKKRCEKESLEKASSELALEIKEKRELLGALKTAVSEMARQGSEEERILKQLVQRRGQVERSLALFEMALKQREEELSGLGVVSSDRIEPIEPSPEVQQEKEGLEKEMKNQSALNFSAIEALKGERERFEFLEKQYLDLKKAKSDLENIIEGLESESRRRFLSTFEKIRAGFQANFTRLFNGGRADLMLMGDSDPLHAGVEIIAEPPGQKMKTMTLLSGGERCLTAIALLFALFEVTRPPFCLMDEIDAPLDEANIGRFTNLLAQFIASTQFIVVTHNKRTMALSDLLIGVSMEEKGVSKILSLEFEKEKVNV